MDKNSCIVFANGPSLKDVALDQLPPIPKFGMNLIFKTFQDIDYYFNIHDTTAYPEVSEFIKSRPGMVVFTNDNLWGVPGQMFKRDIFKEGISGFSGWSSIFILLQIPYSLGFRTVYLYGMDACRGKDLHAYEDAPSEKLLGLYDEMFEKMIEVAEIFKKSMPDDYQIFNCSPGSKIKAFPTAAFPILSKV